MYGLQISENGMVTTEDGFYGGLSFPYTKPWIAPFGADIIPAGGTMEYQQFTSTDTTQMNYATQLVNEVYKDASFTAVNALVVTWTDVKIDSGSKVVISFVVVVVVVAVVFTEKRTRYKNASVLKTLLYDLFKTIFHMSSMIYLLLSMLMNTCKRERLPCG
jgi:hypothetical protein